MTRSQPSRSVVKPTMQPFTSSISGSTRLSAQFSGSVPVPERTVTPPASAKAMAFTEPERKYPALSRSSSPLKV